MNTAAMVQSFLYSRRSLNRRPSTVAWYERNLKRFVDFFTELPMEPESLEQFMAEVVPYEQEETRRAYYRILKALYRFVCRRHRLVNPMEFIDPPPRHKKIKASLTAGELMLLLTKPIGMRDRALLTFLVDSGCRAGEVASLRPQNIYEGYVMVEGKTGQRFAFISEETRRLLLNLVAINRSVAGNNGNSYYVFLGQRGVLTPSGIYRIVSNYLRAVGIAPPKMGPHRLRHAFGRNYILNGGDTRSLQEIMGHENISVTEGYIELSPEEIRAKHHRFTPLRSAHAAAQGSLFDGPGILEEAEAILAKKGK